MSDRTSVQPFLPLLKYTWVQPFWLRAIPFPLPPAKRLAVLSELRDYLNRHCRAPSISAWHVEDLRQSAEPWRAQLRTGWRLAAVLEEDRSLLDHLRELLEAAGCAETIEVQHVSARLYYEDFGLGAIEYKLIIRAIGEDASASFDAFLGNGAFWAEPDFYGLVSRHEFAVQKDWPAIAAAFKTAIESVSDLRHFKELEKFASWKTSDRDDDFTWSMCMDVVLFRDPEFQIEGRQLEELVERVHEFGCLVDSLLDPRRGKTSSGEIKTGYATTDAILVGDGNQGSVDICYSGFGCVVVVSETQPDWIFPFPGEAGDNPYGSVSERVIALRRNALVAYSALTEAADGLRAFLADILLAEDDFIEGRHEELRRVSAALAMIRYDRDRHTVEADDVETRVFEAFSRAWGLEEQAQLLDQLMRDADRATSRMSEAVTHREEKNLGIMLLFLGIITLTTTAKDFVEFVFDTEHPSRVEGIPLAIHAGILAALWFIALLFAWHFRLWRPRWLDRFVARQAER